MSYKYSDDEIKDWYEFYVAKENTSIEAVSRKFNVPVSSVKEAFRRLKLPGKRMHRRRMVQKAPPPVIEMNLGKWRKLLEKEDKRKQLLLRSDPSPWAQEIVSRMKA